MAAVLLIAVLAPLAQATERSGQVVRILDGDTIEVLVDRTPLRVRLVAIDAPEKRQAFGERARQHLAELVFQRRVTVTETGTDRYGRTLGVVRLASGPSANALMVRDGMAWVYRRYSTDASLLELEASARSARVGLWADAHPIPPWEFRQLKLSRQ